MASPQLLKKIRDEITSGGLRHEKKRTDDARQNLDFYWGRFDAYAPKVATADYDKIRPRYSLAMQRVVNTLTANLYKDGPRRKLGEDDKDAVRKRATTWLNNIYKANAIDAQWQQADRLATAADAAAFQVSPSSDPFKPVRIQIWDASQLVVWLDPDDQLTPAAVGVIDQYNEQRRLRVYTTEVVQTYLTRPLEAKQTAGGTAFEWRDERPNTIVDADGNGVIPFCFVHFNMPLCDFWTYGPGSFLRDMNDAANALLTQIGGCIRYNLIPILVGKGIAAGWNPPKPVRPGDLWMPPSTADSNGETPVDPSFEYLQADSSFVAAGWDDLNNYLDHTLEMCGVPPATVRMVQDSARSGVSIIAEQAPLILWAQSRQRPFAHYEECLARLVLTVGALHLSNQAGETLATLPETVKASVSDLEEAAYDPQLTLRWPKMYPDMPGPDQDASDDWLLQHQMASRTTLLMRRESMNRDEARAYLEEIADDLEDEADLFKALEPDDDEAKPGDDKPADAKPDDETPEPKPEPKPKAEDDERDDAEED